MDSGIYRCWANYTDLAGYRWERCFFLMHDYGDGALVLGAKVMLEFDKQRDWPVVSEYSAWLDFCAEHNLNPYEALGSHVKLKE